MNIGKVEENIQSLIENFSQDNFIYDLLLAYDLPKSSITRLKEGSYNLSKNKNGHLFGDGEEILWKKKLFYKVLLDKDLHAFIDQLRHDVNTVKHSPRFMIVTDYETLLAYDTKTKDTLDVKLTDLAKHFDFFLPWAGMEKAQAKIENPADVKAAVKMAKLYDLIRQDNPDEYKTNEALHELNVFLSRLLFCYFAEDTEIFPTKLFCNSVSSHTQADGSDLQEYLNRLFEVLNRQDRKSYPKYLQEFPYVNGGLFNDQFKAPQFTARSRKVLIECGSELNWSAINPDIFGSMIQAVVHPAQRGGMGMHYTSVSNIMKAIEPLFLNDLNEEFEKNKFQPQKLEKLLARISMIRIFDPACGSGNFLIIAYKELRHLEIRILQQLQLLSKAAAGSLDDIQASLIPKAQLNLAAAYTPSLFSRIQLSQFYGIELDDFAHEVAILSLWLAEHQMNVKFKEAFGQARPSLPLKESGKIMRGNAAPMDWKKVCPLDKDVEIYLLGNPPYRGSSLLEPDQKKDMDSAFAGINNYKNLDYIALWFYKAAKYIAGVKAEFAFVSTNSICQGEQVLMLWPHIFDKNLEIGFAHDSFKWSNNAKKNAAVFCIIIGIRNASSRAKYIYKDSVKLAVENINPYLVPSKTNVILPKRSSPLSGLPQMSYGNKPTDGGHLLLTPDEKRTITNQYPESEPFFKKILGANEFTNGLERWCLWIDDDQLAAAKKIPPIAKRISQVSEMRRESPKIPTQRLAETPHRFGEIRHRALNSILVPRHGSERREYMPFGFVTPDIVISDAAQVIYTNEMYVFGIISSKLHLAWIKASCGKIKEDPRYSSALGYNTFPVPNLTDKQKSTINTHVFNVLEEREKHSEKTIAELYDPKKMPAGLKEAHEGLDLAVERCYRSKPFISDEERLEHLFKLYEDMTSDTRRVANE